MEYVDPKSKEQLEYNKVIRPNGKSEEVYISPSGFSYPVTGGMVNFLGQEVTPQELSIQSFYDKRAEAYDKFLHLTFLTHNEDEQAVRNTFIDLLNLDSSRRVLEVAAGTGRDSELIAKRLPAGAEFCITDIAPKMLAHSVERLKVVQGPELSFALCGADRLPFADDYFDALYSFGGLGEFPDIAGSLREMARVVRPGGKIVVGDESMPPWLRETMFAKILTKTNPQFEAPLPLEHLPVEARNVRIQFVIGGVFYLIDFEVGKGEPDGNFDFEIPGTRGGTYRTRYEGQLEGVTPEAKNLYERAARHTGKSMHQWLDDVVRQAAERDLAE